MKSKIFLFIGLIAILSNAIVVSNDQQQLEEIPKIENVDQVVISEKVAAEIKEMLNKEIKQLTDQKAFLQGIFYKYITPASCGIGVLFITWFQIFCLKARIKNLYKGKLDYFLFKMKCLLGMKDRKDFSREHFHITLPLALILLQKKFLSAAWNHKQKTVAKIQKIDAEIERNYVIVAQLQQQQQ